MPITIKRVDYRNPKDATDLMVLLAEYIEFETGRQANLQGITDQLAQFPTALSVLAYDDESRTRPIGLVNGFFGFSTFERRPLINIHDVIVTASERGKGVAARMLDEVRRIAEEQHCCRLTLEVYADNEPARRAYEKFGFSRDPSHPDVDVLFLRKPLTNQPTQTDDMSSKS